MSSAALHQAVRVVLERAGDGELVDGIVAALERTPHRTEVRRLLEARRPEREALVSPMDGTVHLHGDRRITIGVHAGDMRTEVGVVMDAGRLRVEDGEQVTAGQALTDGEISVDAIVHVHGESAALEHVTARLRELLGLPAEQAEALARPIFSRVLLKELRADEEERGVLMTRERFEAHPGWFEGSAIMRCTYVLSGYPDLAAHVDPPDAFFVARLERIAAEERQEEKRRQEYERWHAEEEKRREKEAAENARVRELLREQGPAIDDALWETASSEGLIAAIKQCRAAQDVGLVEAKRYVEALLARRPLPKG